MTLTELPAPAVSERLNVPPTPEEWELLLARAMRGEGVSIVFQPIIDLQRVTVVGYESLARFQGAPGFGPDRWFAAAASRGMVDALDAAVLQHALARRQDLPPNCFMTVNLEPESLLSDRVTSLLQSAGSLRGLVVEITEHRPIPDPVAAERVLQWLRNRGAMVALDDAGTGFAGLHQILELRPSILKLDRSLVAGVDRDEARAALIEMLGVFANRVDAWLLAEGVETEAEARRLIELKVPLAQGYFFARPSPPWAAIASGVNEVFEAQRLRGRTGLYGMVEAMPWVNHHQAAASQGLLQGDEAMLVVLDDSQRPVGVLTRNTEEAMATPMVANVNSTPREVAHRLATRKPLDTANPVLITDNAGRYVGVVSVARLLASLAET